MTDKLPRVAKALNEDWTRDLEYDEAPGEWLTKPHSMCFGDVIIWVIPKTFLERPRVHAAEHAATRRGTRIASRAGLDWANRPQASPLLAERPRGPCLGSCRHVTRSRTILAVLLAIFLTETIHAATCRSVARRWNVVLIVADDLGWGEVGCFGQQRIPTPHLDRLAAQGMRLTRHYSGAPTCAPSRCTLLTGLHTGHADIRGNRQASQQFPQFSEGQHPIAADTWTLAEAFRAAGYRTAAFGKWGLGPVGSTGDPNDQGFDLFFGYNCQSVAHSYYPPHLWRNRERVTLNVQPIPAHPKLADDPVRMEDWIGEQYAPQRMVDEAVSFVETQGRKRPFFLYLPLIEPHVAMHPPAESLARFPAEWDQQPYRGENGYLPHPRPRAAYAAMIADLDDHVGRILSALDRQGLASNTLVIFTSDNGTTHTGRPDSPFSVGGVDPRFFNSTRGLRGFKGSLHEGGIRVPTIVRLPGQIPAASTSAAPSYFPDWFPTLAEATGIHCPPHADGESLWRQLRGRPAPPRSRPLVWVFAEYKGQVAVRIGSAKIIRKDLLTPQPGPWEVYNLEQDEQEQHDLAASRPDLVRMAEQILACELIDNPTFPVRLPANSALPQTASTPASTQSSPVLASTPATRLEAQQIGH